MKNILRLTAVPVLLASLAFGQASSGKTTTTATTTDPTSIKGCLAGSPGSYSLTQDGSPQSFKITTSAVNLRPHVGHDVELTGKRVSAAGFGATDSTLTVTALKMIADHCATGASSASTTADPTTTATPAVPTGGVISSTVSSNGGAGTAGTPAAADATTATNATPAASTATPATTASAPAADPASATVTTGAATSPTGTSAPANSVPPTVAATTATAASKTPADASTPVMASDRATLPNTPAPTGQDTQVTGTLGADGKTFVSDGDSKSWTVSNPDAVKGHEGHHVVLTAQVDANTSQVNVVSLKMAK